MNDFRSKSFLSRKAYSLLILLVYALPCLGTKVEQRNLKTFLPKIGESIDTPNSQLVQILLDRQIHGASESYMVQILFHSLPAEHKQKQLDDRIIIDFLDCSKPAMRIAKIRGGIISGSSIEELFYKLPANQSKAAVANPSISRSFQDTTQLKGSRVKHMVRLTLFLDKKIQEIKVRDTLDRILIHFSMPILPRTKD